MVRSRENRNKGDTSRDRTSGSSCSGGISRTLMKSSCALVVALERRFGHRILLNHPLKEELKRFKERHTVKKHTFFSFQNGP
jgi:hypothetical protein